MEKLKRMIEEKGTVLSPTVLKVDSFLNHCIDTEMMEEIGEVFAAWFQEAGITKVITIESGGIAPAYAAAHKLGVPILFAKKTEPCTMTDPLTATVHSYTKNTDYQLCAEHSMLQPEDVVLFIDDFLANGQAFLGVQALIEQAGARLGGVGICVEKSWQDGRALIIDSKAPLCVLASIKEMQPPHTIIWNTPNETC